jgi:hypothetical protein
MDIALDAPAEDEVGGAAITASDVLQPRRHPLSQVHSRSR